MAYMDKINVDELQDAVGGKDDTVESGIEPDSIDTKVKKYSHVFSYPALSLLVKLVDQYYRKKNS